MSITTSKTLLCRLNNMNDHKAWERFYELYSPLIISFACRQNCTRTMAYDVLQESMVCLMRLMPKFSYNPKLGKFRSLLFKIADSRIKDAFRRNKRLQLLSGDGKDNNSIENIEDSKIDPPGKAWDDLWDQNLVLQALETIKKHVTPVTYRSFEMNVFEGRSIDEISKELGLSANTIYQHKNRIIKMLRKEVDFLQDEIGD